MASPTALRRSPVVCGYTVSNIAQDVRKARDAAAAGPILTARLADVTRQRRLLPAAS